MTTRKAQFFIVTAVVLVGILFFISQLLLDTIQLPVNEVENDPAIPTHYNMRSTIHEAWWNGSFETRQTLDITEHTGRLLPGHAVKTTLTDLTAMAGDCSDLRITENGELTPFFIASCTGDGATVWIRHTVDADTTEDDVTVYYDSNPDTDATRRESPREDVFTHFEDSDSVTEWAEHSPSGWEIASASGGVYRSTNTGGDMENWTVYNETGERTTFRNMLLVDTRVNTSGGENMGVQFWHNDSTPGSETYWMVNMTEGDATDLLNVSVTEKDGGSITQVAATDGTQCTVNTWCTLTLQLFEDTINITVDGTRIISTRVERDSNDRGYTGLHGHSNEQHDFDNVTIRLFADPAPTVSQGGKEDYDEVMEKLEFSVAETTRQQPYTISLSTGNCTLLTVDSFTYRIEELVC